MGEIKGKWNGAPYFNSEERKWIIQLELEEAPVVYDKTKNDLISVEIKKYRKDRSGEANRYFHKLCSMIAKSQGISLTEVKNQMISDYGYRDEEMQDIILKDSIDWRRLEKIHLQPTSATRIMDNGVLYRVYYVMRGSHTYDTKEMSVLIDGTVQEAKQLGIETLPPDMLRRMKEQWGVS
jgi:hypothetical protein